MHIFKYPILEEKDSEIISITENLEIFNRVPITIENVNDIKFQYYAKIKIKHLHGSKKILLDLGNIEDYTYTTSSGSPAITLLTNYTTYIRFIIYRFAELIGGSNNVVPTFVDDVIAGAKGFAPYFFYEKEFKKRRAYIILKDENDRNLDFIKYTVGDFISYTNKIEIPISSDGIIDFNLLSFIRNEILLAIKLKLIKSTTVKLYFSIVETNLENVEILIREKNTHVTIESKTKKGSSNFETEIFSIPILINLMPYYISSVFSVGDFNLIPIDISNMVAKNIPTYSKKVSPHRFLKESLDSILINNGIIINRIEKLLQIFIFNGMGDILNLYSDGTLVYASNGAKYTGIYFYNHTAKTFFTGKDSADTTKQELKYDGIFDINSIHKNFDFASILLKEKRNLLNNISELKISYNSIIINLNKKLSYSTGIQKTLIQFYKNFKDLISGNLKYFRNYKNVKKFSVGGYVARLNFQKIYLEFLDSLFKFYVENNSISDLFDEALGIISYGKDNLIKIDSAVFYNDLVSMVISSVQPNAVSDRNYPIVKAFANINKTLLAFLEDFENINSRLNSTEYNNFLLVALELDIDSLLTETYDGVLLLQTKLNNYLVKNVYNLGENPKTATIMEFIIKKKSRKELLNFMNSITKLLVVIKELKLIFLMNKSYNIFLDFDVRESKNNIDQNTEVNKIMHKYDNNSGTNFDILSKKTSLSLVSDEKPLVIQAVLTDRSSIRPWIGFNYQYWKLRAQFYIPIEYITSFKIEEIEYDHYFIPLAGPNKPVLTYSELPKWNGSKLFEFITNEVEVRHNSDHHRVITTIKYSWKKLNTTNDEKIYGSHVFSVDVHDPELVPWRN